MVAEKRAQSAVKRGPGGLFVKGHVPISPGRPRVTTTAAERRATFIAAVSPEQLEKIAAALVARALDGDTTAARIVLAYLIGAPEVPEVSDASRPVVTIAAEGAALLDLREDK